MCALSEGICRSVIHYGLRGFRPPDRTTDKPAVGMNRGEREKRASEADADIDETEEEDEIYYYQGDHIDLAPMLREQMILAAPIQPLCSENCAGLCPRCGQNLNEERCACAPEPVIIHSEFS